jgi:hypothetical protein
VAQTEISSPPAFSESKEHKLIWLLCGLAALHVFIFSAAFPFFNNVDEQPDFDLVVKYSHAHIPTSLEPFSTNALTYIALYHSYAFMGNPTNSPGGQFPPPPWKQPAQEISRMSFAKSAVWQMARNYECSQPPLYYMLAGFWWYVGQWFGLEGGHLLYWLRFLNILLVAALVWLGYITTRVIFPDNPFLRISVPVLMAFLPQTAFYSIDNDVLSPLCLGVAFFFLVKWLRPEIPRVRSGAMMGLALAVAFLTKMSNLPLLAVALVVVVLKIHRLAIQNNFRAVLPAASALFLCAGLPMGLWIAWCKIHFGDFTGSEVKIEHFGWVHKPFGEWFNHPIFTLHGLWTFVSGLFATFWQGEFFWLGRPMTSPVMNVIYTVATLFLLGVAGQKLFSRRMKLSPFQHEALSLALISVTASVLFLVWLSMIFEFGQFSYPSSSHPYFTSGRLMLGALIPFLLLFVFGLDCALKRFGAAAKFFTLTAIISAMLISEIATDWPVFFSEYNWFHM